MPPASLWPRAIPVDRPADDDLLSVEKLGVQFRSAQGAIGAVDNISYRVRRGEIVALVGESGSGKSVSALALMQLLPSTAQVSGRAIFDGRDLLALKEPAMRAVRGREIAMVFQEPMTALNPVLTVGLQLGEPLQVHLGMSGIAARRRAGELLVQVGLTEPEHRLDQYPHELSGGMRQRVMIAMALSCAPKLIIADEPTTALDATLQAQILDLLQDLSRRLGIAVILITHNLGIAARYADRVNVVYAARLIEQAAVEQLFSAPRHFYTLGLLRSIPRLDHGRRAALAAIEGMPPDLHDPPGGCRFAPRCTARITECDSAEMMIEVARGHFSSCARADAVTASDAAIADAAARGRLEEPILEVDGLKKNFKLSGGAVVHAVDEVAFTIHRGETLGLVGESGCGKSTVGRLLLGLETPTAGEIRGLRTRRGFERRIQMMFQDPSSALNPRLTIGRFIAEPLLVHRLVPSRRAARERVSALLDQVGLSSAMAERYPHQLSGGQRQRVGIARALALEPALIVCDEPVSALDVSVQAQVINLLVRLREERALALLFISHDLAVLRHIADRVAVMYLGRIVELASRDAIFEEPRHPYTQALLDAVLPPDPAARGHRARRLEGEIPSPITPPGGCAFHTRCPIATAQCRTDRPVLRALSAGHRVACHNVTIPA